MTNNEARERIAEIIYDAARCLSRQEAIDTGDAVLKAGYRQIDPKKLSVLSEEGIVKASGFITKYWNDIFTFKQCLEGMKVVAQNQLAHTINQIQNG
jgi:hypothetical protein